MIKKPADYTAHDSSKLPHAGKSFIQNSDDIDEARASLEKSENGEETGWTG